MLLLTNWCVSLLVQELNLKRPYKRESDALRNVAKRKADAAGIPDHDEWLNKAAKINSGNY